MFTVAFRDWTFGFASTIIFDSEEYVFVTSPVKYTLKLELSADAEASPLITNMLLVRLA